MSFFNGSLGLRVSGGLGLVLGLGAVGPAWPIVPQCFKDVWPSASGMRVLGLGRLGFRVDQGTCRWGSEL